MSAIIPHLKKAEILRRYQYGAKLLNKVVSKNGINLKQLRRVDSLLYNLETTLEDYLDAKPNGSLWKHIRTMSGVLK